MRGKGALDENSRRRSYSKKKVVLIDSDDDNVVIIDDAPESSHKKNRSSWAPLDRGKSCAETVINIDDDDDDDTGVGVGTDVDADGDLASDASSSKAQFPTFKTMGSSVNEDKVESEFVRKKNTVFQFSKCKQTYCTKSPVKNRYGLDPTFGDDLMDSDSSDCEIILDPYEKCREQWERASRKRNHVRNCNSGFDDQSSTSESNNVARKSFAEGKGKEQCPISGNADCVEETRPEFVARDGGSVGTSKRTLPERLFRHADKKRKETSESVQEKVSPGKNERPHRRDVRQTNEDAFDGILFDKNIGPLPRGFCFCNTCKKYENICDCVPEFWNSIKPRAQEFPFMSFEQVVGDKQAAPPRTHSTERDNLNSGQAFVLNSRLFNKTQVGGARLPNENLARGSEDIFSQRVSAEGNSEGSYGKGCNQDNARVYTESLASHNSTCDRPSSNLSKSNLSGFKKTKANKESAQDAHVTPPVETCIITDREKLKDTDEYRKAAEEEWASRQRELQIQSEEAQKQRRRKKAEILRINDIEKRQKQRVEEVRETQKKNAEDISLKEQLRGEIRKEITSLEIHCKDMASLLRGLGIPVNGSPKPMSQDVNAAYKRALLKFHPDRASRMDMRQQVEAEEKFKLISRMKEKLMTSCY